MINQSVSQYRPHFLESLSNAYSERGKGVVTLTGDVHDLFWCRELEKFLSLEQTLYQALSGMFTVMRLDIATGIDFYDHRDLAKLAKVCSDADSLAIVQEEKIGNLKNVIASTRHSPLPALVLLSEIMQSVVKVRRHSDPSTKPVCAILQLSGAIFPAGDFNQLSEIDRQRLVTFLNLIESPWFVSSNHLIVLLTDTRSEINSRILALPTVHCIEISLPSGDERTRYMEFFLKENKMSAPDLLDGEPRAFIDDTAGLTLTALKDLLDAARRSRLPITRTNILSEINNIMKADLGDIISISKPEHGPSDIVGYEKTGTILKKIFQRCENPETAVPAILVSGPNGAGKTFQLEAYASQSGRVVIELTGLRGMYFGQTDTFFEKLRLRLKTYGKILILIDEAHTQFGSVHKSDTHETEKRLAGNIIKLMGDRTMIGKVLWALMTSRPDELDPDVKSRSPIQVPIFDMAGEERKQFVKELFSRRGIEIPDGDIELVLEKTENYSSRDYDFLIKEVKGSGSESVLETLDVWQASASILRQRRLQTLIAAQHCSYPNLIPESLRSLISTGQLERELEQLKLLFLH